MIPQHIIDQILAVAQVDEIIAEHVDLKKRGANLLGLCPFHNEKTPSFTVSPAKGIYKCFGCGKAGNTVKFLMEYEQLSYPEALRQLADRYNITIPEEEKSEEAALAADHREKLFVIMQFAQRYFTTQLLQSEQGKAVGLPYFKERELRDSSIEAFQLGFSHDLWDGLLEAARSAGYDPADMEEVGLVKKKEERYFDFFRDRVIFPIHNISGKVIAFAGRTLKTDKKIPKYVNSPETVIYNKSQVLYGAFLAKAAMRQADNCYLVEGYTDVISLHQGGIINVVASSGTSLTQEQIRLVKRYTNNITMLYDGDDAGIKAALRGVDLVLEEDMNVKVVVLPDKEDPDSYIKAVGSSEFTRFLTTEATDFILFKLRLMQAEAADDPIRQASLIKEIITTVARIPDALKRSTYTTKIAELLKVRESMLVNELNAQLRKRMQQRARQANMPHSEAEDQALGKATHIQEWKAPAQGEINTAIQERDIIRILMEHGNKLLEKEDITVAEYILDELEGMQDEFGMDCRFQQPAFEKIIALIRKQVDQGKPAPDEQYFVHHEDEQVQQVAIDLLARPTEVSENWEARHQIYTGEVTFEKDVYSAHHRFVVRLIDKEMKHLEKALKEVNSEREEQQLFSKVMLLKKMEQKVIGNTVIKR